MTPETVITPHGLENPPIEQPSSNISIALPFNHNNQSSVLSHPQIYTRSMLDRIPAHITPPVHLAYRTMSNPPSPSTSSHPVDPTVQPSAPQSDHAPPIGSSKPEEATVTTTNPDSSSIPSSSLPNQTPQRPQQPVLQMHIPKAPLPTTPHLRGGCSFDDDNDDEDDCCSRCFNSCCLCCCLYQ